MAEGEHWRHIRKLAHTKVFNKQKLVEFEETIFQEMKKFITFLDMKAETHEPV